VTVPDCPRCHGEGVVERSATPAEAGAGCELGVAYDPCDCATASYSMPRLLPPVWIADCRDCCKPGGRLVVTFDDQAERNAWARDHARLLGHSVYTYQQPGLERSEYPT